MQAITIIGLDIASALKPSWLTSSRLRAKIRT
jgi:hypothetical protein